MQDFFLNSDQEYIQLMQLLKVTHVADSGGMAGQIILDEVVRVNGEIDTRKRAKIRRGDTVEVFDKVIIVK